MAEGHDSRVRFLILAEGQDEQRLAGSQESKKTEVRSLDLDFRLLALAFKTIGLFEISVRFSVFIF